MIDFFDIEKQDISDKLEILAGMAKKQSDFRKEMARREKHFQKEFFGLVFFVPAVNAYGDRRFAFLKARDLFFYPNEKTPESLVFYSYMREKIIVVDARLFKEPVDLCSNVDLMVYELGFGKVRRRSSVKEEFYLKAIPSPITREEVARWDSKLLPAYKDGKPIEARIANVMKQENRFSVDLGCALPPIFIGPIYSKEIKPGASIDVIIKKIAIRSHAKENPLKIKIRLSDGENEKRKAHIKKERQKKLDRQREKTKNALHMQGSDLFIFDTGVILDFPQLFEVILEAKKQICIPNDILEELDGLKNTPDRRAARKARRGLNAINKHIGLIQFEKPQAFFLPDGMDKTKSGNRIISLAISLKDKNPVIVTGDLGVIVKAKSQGVWVWEFGRFKNGHL